MQMISDADFHSQPFSVSTMDWRSSTCRDSSNLSARHKQVLSSLTSPAMNQPYRADVYSNAFYHHLDVPVYHSQRASSPASSSGPDSPHYVSYNNCSPASTSMPRVSIFPQMTASSSLNTPSSVSSLSVLTPLSPPLAEFTDYYKENLLDEDDIEMDESESDDEDIDSDFADEMDGVDEVDMEEKNLRSTSSWHQESMNSFTSISALDGALGHYSRSTNTDRSHFRPQDIDDRKMSMSAPGHPRVSYPQLDAPQVHHAPHHHHHHQQQRHEPNNTYYSTASRSHHHSPYLYPQPDSYTHVSPSSTALFAPPPMHTAHHSMQPPANYSNAVPTNTYNNSRRSAAPVPILQPQPIRPIPPIPLSDLAAASEEDEEQSQVTVTAPSRADVPDDNRLMKSEKSPGLSPLSLLCQPVSDAVRYQLKTTGDVTGNTSSEEDEEEEGDDDASDTEEAVDVSSAYAGIISEDMILPSNETAYFDSRLTRPNKVKQFQCDCGCMGVCLG